MEAANGEHGQRVCVEEQSGAQRRAGSTTATGHGQGVCVEEQSGAQRRSETHTPCPCPGPNKKRAQSRSPPVSIA
jgi:hypothetical protein